MVHEHLLVFRLLQLLCEQVLQWGCRPTPRASLSSQVAKKDPGPDPGPPQIQMRSRYVIHTTSAHLCLPIYELLWEHSPEVCPAHGLVYPACGGPQLLEHAVLQLRHDRVLHVLQQHLQQHLVRGIHVLCTTMNGVASWIFLFFFAI